MYYFHSRNPKSKPCWWLTKCIFQSSRRMKLAGAQYTFCTVSQNMLPYKICLSRIQNSLLWSQNTQYFQNCFCTFLPSYWIHSVSLSYTKQFSQWIVAFTGSLFCLESNSNGKKLRQWENISWEKVMYLILLWKDTVFCSGSI